MNECDKIRIMSEKINKLGKDELMCFLRIINSIKNFLFNGNEHIIYIVNSKIFV